MILSSVGIAARLEVRDVSIAFGGLYALADVNLTFEPGQIIGIIGPNGSGKTTLLDTISGQLFPTNGQLLFDGVDLIDYLPEDRAALGLVRSFQDCRLYPELTVEETLLVAHDAHQPVSVLGLTFRLPMARRAEFTKRGDAGELLETFHLERFRHHQIGQLSTGTRRIVDLACAVAGRPRLLLLDEPTAGIAQREAEAFGPLLHTLHRVTGATIVLVEHDVPLTVEVCERLVVMEAGRIVSDGPVARVLADPVAREAYLGASEEALARSGAQPATRRGT
jgi:ABC-type branched-subunit amino acid transport system ATPase component